MHGEILVSPLRERREDIAALCEHFLSKRGARLTAGALSALEACHWPGNIRQLRNVLHATASLAPDGVIETHDLELLDCGPPGDTLSDERPPPLRSDVAPSHQSLEQTERTAIIRALEVHRGNVSRAADAVGIHSSTLRRKLRALGIGRSTRQ